MINKLHHMCSYIYLTHCLSHQPPAAGIMRYTGSVAYSQQVKWKGDAAARTKSRWSGQPLLTRSGGAAECLVWFTDAYLAVKRSFHRLIGWNTRLLQGHWFAATSYRALCAFRLRNGLANAGLLLKYKACGMQTLSSNLRPPCLVPAQDPHGPPAPLAAGR